MLFEEFVEHLQAGPIVMRCLTYFRKFMVLPNGAISITSFYMNNGAMVTSATNIDAAYKLMQVGYDMAVSTYELPQFILVQQD